MRLWVCLEGEYREDWYWNATAAAASIYKVSALKNPGKVAARSRIEENPCMVRYHWEGTGPIRRSEGDRTVRRRYAIAWAAILLVGLVSAPSTWGAETTAAPVKEDAAARLEKIFGGDAPDGIDDLKAMQEHVQELTAKVLPSTVGVQIGQAWGSGVIISKDGYVLTAAHVAGNANRDAMFVLSDGQIVRGKTLGLNRELDAGLMKITEKGEFPFVEMGTSKEAKEGQWCLAVGHPGGYQKDRGLVVRLGRVLLSDKDAITSDCTLVGGDSGGPLFDMHGHVIGINSRIAGKITANLHVPVDAFRDGWDRLVKADVWGHLPGQKPILGVTGVEGVEMAKIATVRDESPAAQAGFKKGDVVTRFGDADISDFGSLKKAVLDHDPGEKVAVKVKRGEDLVDLTVVLGREFDD